MEIRELTNKEQQEIRHLVKDECANYDKDYGCIPLDTDCFMFGKAYNGGAMCKYFKSSVLPLNPELERVFTGEIAPDTKPCKVCGSQFPVNGRQAYCSEKCSKINRRKSVAKNVSNHRKRKLSNVIN